jgi:peroxiredoxin Q/BCP
MATRELSVGNKAPGFRGEATIVGNVSLDDYSGKPLVLFFYPKDSTSG